MISFMPFEHDATHCNMASGELANKPLHAPWLFLEGSLGGLPVSIGPLFLGEIFLFLHPVFLHDLLSQEFMHQFLVK